MASSSLLPTDQIARSKLPRPLNSLECTTQSPHAAALTNTVETMARNFQMNSVSSSIQLHSRKFVVPLVDDSLPTPTFPSNHQGLIEQERNAPTV